MIGFEIPYFCFKIPLSDYLLSISKFKDSILESCIGRVGGMYFQ
jgi:hypothetical protein